MHASSLQQELGDITTQLVHEDFTESNSPRSAFCNGYFLRHKTPGSTRRDLFTELGMVRNHFPKPNGLDLVG